METFLNLLLNYPKIKRGEIKIDRISIYDVDRNMPIVASLLQQKKVHISSGVLRRKLIGSRRRTITMAGGCVANRRAHVQSVALSVGKRTPCRMVWSFGHQLGGASVRACCPFTELEHKFLNSSRVFVSLYVVLLCSSFVRQWVPGPDMMNIIMQ